MVTVADRGADIYDLFIGNRRKPVFIITDGHPVHKSKKVREFVASMKGRLSIFILPPYAPDLNPDELVWNYIRQTGFVGFSRLRATQAKENIYWMLNFVGARDKYDTRIVEYDLVKMKKIGERVLARNVSDNIYSILDESQGWEK